MPETKDKYLIHWTINNVGPHENLNQSCDAGENGPIRIGVFSPNGGGKSSVSRQFRLLNIDKDKLPLSNKYITLGKRDGKFKFKLFNQENTSEKYEFEIIHALGDKPQITDTSQLIFHVFNSDYVRESIEPQNYGQDNKIEGYIIGKEAVGIEKETQELEALRKKYKNIQEVINTSISDAQHELQRYGVRANMAEFKSFTFENIIGNYVPTIENDSFTSIKEAFRKLEGIPDDLADVSIHRNFNINTSFILDIISDLKEKISVSQLSSEFKSKIQSKENFIKMGVQLLDDKKSNCPFCEQNLRKAQHDLIDNFISYIYDSETVYRNKLQGQIKNINELKTLFENIYKEFIKIESQFNKNKSYFPSLINEKLEIIEDPLNEFEWSKIEEIINLKIKYISDSIEDKDITTIQHFNDNIVQFCNIINDFIRSNNKKIKRINDTKLNTGAEVLSLKRRMCNAKYIELKLSLKTQLEAESNYKKAGTAKSDEIKIKESKAKIPKKDIVIEVFNGLMQFIFSDKYTFDKENSQLKFKSHSLKTSAHYILSDGEKNVIAFCYYIAETHTLIENKSDYDKLFFIIDDPISSMDFHYTYSLCRILEHLNEFFDGYSNRKKLRFILFTHNIEFMSILLRNNVIQKKYVLTPGKLKELKKELVMPYHEHLSDIYKVANNAQEPTHTTPNSMRNVLETIGRFEDPNQDLIAFVDKNEDLKKCSSLYNMIQDLSHGVVRSQPAIFPEDVKKGCVTIVKFLENRYKGQIDNVKKTI
jgi:hypothetical protein